jgi:hypothetical protein
MNKDQIAEIVNSISQGVPEAAGGVVSTDTMVIASIVAAMLCGYLLVGTPRMMGIILSIGIGVSAFGVSAVGIANARVVHPDCAVILGAIQKGSVDAIEDDQAQILISSCGQLAYMGATQAPASHLRYGYQPG